jgi:pyruvate dehydrogenase E1 component alpha subunit
VVVDGSDVLAVQATVAEAVARARSGGGATFIEAQCERLTGHLIHDTQGYRSKEELEAVWQRCPIQLFGERLQREGVLSAAERARMTDEVNAEVAAAVDWARAQPYPEPHEAYEDLWA